MVRLCTYHQKHFVCVLNDICTDIQPGCEGHQLPGPENMDVSTCSSGCSQYRTENQELGTSCSESKIPSSLDPEQSGPHGSLRILCHALKQAVDLKSIDKRENCSPVVRRNFPELPSIRTSSSGSRDSPNQGYLTASNSYHAIKSLEGQIPGSEQDMGVRKGEDDKDQMQSRGLLGGYIAVKASNVNSSENNLEGSQNNPFKALPEETREPAFTASSPRRADKENALQCCSKSSLLQDTEMNDQEARQKVENHFQSSGKSKGSHPMHPVDKTHLENAKDSWLPASCVPVVHHKATNGHSRAKNISASTKSTRKSKRSSGLRINDYDNQCDVVYISQPITECHFESKRVMSAKKTARKSTRGYYYNGECCELPTVRTLAKTSHVQESGSTLAPRPEVPISPCQKMSLPDSSYMAAAQATSAVGDKRSSLLALPQNSTDKKSEPCPAESNLPETKSLHHREASSAEAPIYALSPLSCPASNAEEGNLSISSFQETVASSPLLSEGELQEKTDTGTGVQAGSRMDSCSSPKEDGSNAVDSVSPSISGAVIEEESSRCLEKETAPEPLVIIAQEPPSNMNLLSEEPASDLLLPLEKSAAGVDLPLSGELSADVEPNLLCPIDLAESQSEPFAHDSMNPSSPLPTDLSSNPENVSLGELATCSGTVSPVVFPASVETEPATHSDLEPPSVESPVTVPDKVVLEPPHPLSNSDTAQLPSSVQCACADESINMECNTEGTQSREERQSEINETPLSIAENVENVGLGTAEKKNDTSKECEGKEADSEPSLVPNMAETRNTRAFSSKVPTDKKRKREKKCQVSSDRCLRSQQSLLPTEDNSEQPDSSTSLQLPHLQIKLSKSPVAKRFKQEMHFDKAASVCLPNECFHKTLLNDFENTLGGETTQKAGEGNGISMRQTDQPLLVKETAEEVVHDGEDNKNKPGTTLEICLEANSDKNSINAPVENVNDNEKRADLKPDSPGNSDDTVAVTTMLETHRGTTCPPCPESMKRCKDAPPKKSVKCKKPALQFYNLRHPPASIPVTPAQKNNSGKETVQSDSDITDQQNTRNEDSAGFSSMEMLSDNKPRFVEWCNEEENQELITNFNTQYMKVQKGWIQLEKEPQPAPKVKNKSDKLKEIWKSKKRTRKFKGSAEVQKLSPVQMLFIRAFNVSNICKWFMETTETKSLVIVKKLNTRLPGDIPLIKLPLQKGCSSGIYSSSLQAERLKKHLKKFAAMTPAKNTIKTQRMWAKLRENAEETEPEQASSPKRAPPSEVNFPPQIEPQNAQPAPSAPVQTSSQILRKYSNLRGKLHGQNKASKQEKSDCVTKQPLPESKQGGKSMCIKPLVSPKLAQPVKTAPLPIKSTLAEKGGKGRKGKVQLQEDPSGKGSPQPSRKKAPNESSRAQGQTNTASKDKLPPKKASKLKHVEASSTQKPTGVEKSKKKAPQNEKAKKSVDSRPGQKKLPAQKDKADSGQKVTQPSKQGRPAKSPKQKMTRDSSSRCPKVATKKPSSGKALTRSMTQIQENKTAQGKRKLRAQKDSLPSKRRRLDAK